MARLCISNKQVNRLVRTILWQRLAERALRGTYFGDIPAEVNPPCPTLQIYSASVKPLLRRWQTCLLSLSKDTNRVPSYLKSRAVEKAVQLLFWQCQQQHEQPLGSHAVPAWPSAQIPIGDLWLQCLLSPGSLGHCPGQFLS